MPWIKQTISKIFGYLLKEDGGYLLLESGGKIVLEHDNAWSIREKSNKISSWFKRDKDPNNSNWENRAL